MARAQRIPKTVKDWQEYLGDQETFDTLNRLLDANNIDLDLDAAAEALDGDKKHQEAARKTLIGIMRQLDKKSHPHTIEPTKADAKESKRRERKEQKKARAKAIKDHIITKACAATLRVGGKGLKVGGKTVNTITPKQERMGVFNDYKWKPSFKNPFHFETGKTQRNLYGIHGVPLVATRVTQALFAVSSIAVIGAVIWGTNPADITNKNEINATANLSGVSIEGQEALATITHPVERIVAQGLLKEFTHPKQQESLTALIHSAQKFNVPVILPATFMKIESDHGLREQSIKSSNTPQGTFQFSKNRWLETLWHNAKAYPDVTLMTRAGELSLKEIKDKHLKVSKGIIRLKDENHDQFIVDMRSDPQSASDVKLMEIKRKYPEIVERYQYADGKFEAAKSFAIDHSLGNAFNYAIAPTWKSIENAISNGQQAKHYDAILSEQLIRDAKSIYKDHQQGTTGKKKFNKLAFSGNPNDLSRAITDVMSYSHASNNPLFYKRDASTTVGEAEARIQAVVRGIINDMRENATKHASPLQIQWAQGHSRVTAFTAKPYEWKGPIPINNPFKNAR